MRAGPRGGRRARDEGNGVCANRCGDFGSGGVPVPPTRGAKPRKVEQFACVAWHGARFPQRMRTPLAFGFLSALLALTSPALAQELEPVEVPPPLPSSEAEWRLDILGPTVGIGVFLAPAVGYQQGLFTIGGEVRLAHRSGSGLLLRVAHGTNIWGGGTVTDLAYLHRVTLLGGARRGGGLDFAVGPSFAWLSHNQGDVPPGAALGGQAGIALQGREENFSASVGAQLHGFVPLQAAPNGGPTGFELAISVMGGLGFGFY